MWRWFGDEYGRENLMLAVLVVATLLVAVYALASRGAEKDGQGELAAMMPGNYKPVLAALIRAGGGECDAICNAAVDAPVLGSRRVVAACAVDARNIGCRAPLVFEVKVAPAPEPSR